LGELKGVGIVGDDTLLHQRIASRRNLLLPGEKGPNKRGAKKDALHHQASGDTQKAKGVCPLTYPIKESHKQIGRLKLLNGDERKKSRGPGIK